MDKYPHYTIGELCNIEKGLTGIASAIPGEYPLVNTSAERKSCNTYQFDTEAVCIPLVSSTGHGKKSLNYVHYQEGKFALGTILAAVIPKEPQKLSAAFLHRYLQFNKDRKIVPLMRGAANVSLAVKDIAKIEIPVPPIDEQTSFIELFNNLNDSSIKLQSEFSNQSSFLTLLRQSILQEAIEGKLTETWRKKNPVREGDPEYDATSLLEKIKAEKQKMIAEGKIKKEKPLTPIKPEELPFELPEGWVLTRLGEVTTATQGIQIQKSNQIKNIQSEYIRYLYITDFINDDNLIYIKNIYPNKRITENNLVMVNTGSTAGTVFYGKSGILSNNLFYISFDEKFININFLYLFLKSSHFEGKKVLKGAANPHMGHKKYNESVFFIPSISEQIAIVKRVNRLLTMVDELEKQVTEQKGQAEDLMQAVLREAFEGGK